MDQFEFAQTQTQFRVLRQMAKNSLEVSHRKMYSSTNEVRTRPSMPLKIHSTNRKAKVVKEVKVKANVDTEDSDFYFEICAALI